MRVTFCRSLPFLVLSGLLTASLAIPAAAASPATSSGQAPVTYPQIVRLSYVEGDVRISRGKLAEKEDAKAREAATGWEQAVANLPIKEGYSLVTGNGRAAIEFEDASTVYLDKDSVLTFNQLSSTAGIPYSEIGLLAGTATLHVQLMMMGEAFNLDTPSDRMGIAYPQRVYARVDSYLDAASITPQQNMVLRLAGSSLPRPSAAGQTVSFNHGIRVMTPAAANPSASSDWDAWVAKRVAARSAAMSAAMKDAGLTEPVPGLDALNGQGHFFACAPYGTCWEPTNGWDGHATDVALVDSAPQSDSGTHDAPASAAGEAPPAHASKAMVSPKQNGLSKADIYLAAHPGATFYTEDFVFPCSAAGVRDLYAIDPATGREQFISSEFSDYGYPISAAFAYPIGFPHRGFSPFWAFDAFGGYYPWDWAVCHAGSWIRWRHHYVWVAGGKRRHRHPVRWVKTGHTVGFVPVHPRDVAGKRPINLKDGLFQITGRKGQPVDRMVLKEDEPLRLLAETPKEFRDPVLEPLKSAETPHPAAYSVFAVAAVDRGPGPAKGSSLTGSMPARTEGTKDQGTPINFDRKSQTFTVARQMSEGGRQATVVQALGGGGGNSFRPGSEGSSMARTSNSGGGGYSNAGGGPSRASGPSYSGGGGSYHGGGAPSGGGGGGGGGHSGGGAPSGGGGGAGSSGGGGHK